MYLGGRLVHADYMFNGYGTTKRDFMKQVRMWPHSHSLHCMYESLGMRLVKRLLCTLSILLYEQRRAILVLSVPLQVQQCMEEGRKGHCLPSDFKFSQQTGTKIPGSSTWAYPLAGVLEDLVPFTPVDSHSGFSSQQSFVAPDGSRRSMTAESKLTMDYLG